MSGGGGWPSRAWAAGAVLRPMGEVTGFCVAFLVLSLLCALPFALASGRTVLGIGYILPFTVAFVLAYQKLVHGEGLRELGLDPRAACLRLTLVGFVGCGCGVLGLQVLHLEAGSMGIRSINTASLGLPAVAGGLGLALALNLGIGVGEELVFRGYVLRRLLLGYRGPAAGVLVSSLVFSAAHLPRSRDALVLVNLFLLGVVLALAVIVTRSLWASIGIHMGWDFWSDGIYFYRLPGARVARLLTYEYHLEDGYALLAFKMAYAGALIAAAGWLALRVRRRTAHPRSEEHA